MKRLGMRRQESWEETHRRRVGSPDTVIRDHAAWYRIYHPLLLESLAADAKSVSGLRKLTLDWDCAGGLGWKKYPENGTMTEFLALPAGGRGHGYAGMA